MSGPSGRHRRVILGGGSGLGLILAAVLGMALGPHRAADAQIVMAAGPSNEENTSQYGFALPTASEEVSEALEDFERYRKKKVWEKAFRAVQKVTASKLEGMAKPHGGFQYSLRQTLWQSMAELPPEGLEAYRLFNDGPAKKLLESAKGKDEIAQLDKIFTTYFSTSVGDQAADRLGDAYFEQGDFARADECWRAILQYHGTTTPLSRLRLMAKRATALARAGRWPEFHAVQAAVDSEFSGQTIRIGGREVDAAAYLVGLAQSVPKTSSTVASSAGAGPDINLDALSTAEGRMWQFGYMSEQQAKAITNAMQNFGGRPQPPQFVPPVVADDTRLYVNLLGRYIALELATGKLLWRSARFGDLAQMIQQGPYNLAPDDYAIGLHGDRLYGVGREQPQQPQVRLVCLNKATGKEVWTSAKIPELNMWHFSGEPAIVGDRLYIGAIKNGNMAELSLLCLDAATGKKTWDRFLGSYKTNRNQQFMYGNRIAQPTITAHGRSLYIQTEGGALIAVAADTGAIDWGFVFPVESTGQNRFFFYGQPPSYKIAGRPIIADDVIYFKDMNSDMLYALRLSGPKLVWSRSVGEVQVAVAIEGKRIILGGEDVGALDIDTKQLLWSTPVPTETNFLRPYATAHRVYQFTGRGIYALDRAAGETREAIFRGADLGSSGGAVLATPSAVITVSDLAITGYLRPRPKPEAGTQKQEAKGGARPTAGATQGEQRRGT